MSIIARIPTRFLKTALAATAAAALMAGCASGKWGFPYKAPVQQGNWITQEQVSLLQPGMTREQVRFALGSPTLTSVLHADRWDYPYYFKPGYGEAQERKFTVWFENDRLVRWEGDKQPDLQPFQLDAEGKPQEKTDEQLDAETARQQAEGAIQSNLPADAAQLPALGTPPGGTLPADDASNTVTPAVNNTDTAAPQPAPISPAPSGAASQPAPESNMASQPSSEPQQPSYEGSGIRAPSMSGADEMPPSDTATDTARQRELRLNAPSSGSSNMINPSINSAEPLR